MSKIFGIGFHKTATESLRRALEILGYQIYGPVRDISDRDMAQETAREILEDYDGLQDFPWPIFYEWFDNAYPNSKFILTVRPEEDWIDSVQRHFGREEIESHNMVYGSCDTFKHEQKYLDTYRSHNKEVLNYFGDRVGEDLLVMDITNGDGWDKLCPFLGLEKPWIPFPKKNISESRLQKMSYLQQLRARPEDWLQLSLKHYKQGQLLKKILDRIGHVISGRL